jgi:hypothetical protein
LVVYRVPFYPAQDHDVYKKRLGVDGHPLNEGKKHAVGPSKVALKAKELAEGGTNETYCGPCYGAEKEEGQCCNTCQEVGGGGGGQCPTTCTWRQREITERLRDYGKKMNRKET